MILTHLCFPKLPELDMCQHAGDIAARHCTPRGSSLYSSSNKAIYFLLSHFL